MFRSLLLLFLINNICCAEDLELPESLSSALSEGINLDDGVPLNVNFEDVISQVQQKNKKKNIKEVAENNNHAPSHNDILQENLQLRKLNNDLLNQLEVVMSTQMNNVTAKTEKVSYVPTSKVNVAANLKNINEEVPPKPELLVAVDHNFETNEEDLKTLKDLVLKRSFVGSPLALKEKINEEDLKTEKKEINEIKRSYVQSKKRHEQLINSSKVLSSSDFARWN